MQELAVRIKDLLASEGADIVSVGDLTQLSMKERQGYRRGISVGVALRKEVIKGIGKGPTLDYYGEYVRVNELLDNMVESAAAYLRKAGHEAIGLSRAKVVLERDTLTTLLPHKTVATRAGLGWIGKCAMLVTDKYGSAIRVSSILTNAALVPNDPVDDSNCGDCRICGNVCPGQAVKGSNWQAGMVRDEFFDARACWKAASEKAGQIGIDATICGLCMYSCPYTQKYLKS